MESRQQGRWVRSERTLTVTLEQWVTVSGRVVYLDYGLQNDGTPRAAADQEVPVIFPNENFNDLVAFYTGINPWAGEPMTTALPLPSPGTTYTNRENMFFMGNSAGTNGITLLDLDDINFTARTEPWFGYVRCDKEFAIPANAYILRSAVVIPGDYTSARTIAYGLGIGRREWAFDTAGNVENWMQSTDMPAPTVSGGALSGQATGAQSSLMSPDINLFAAGQPRIDVRMSATAGASAKCTSRPISTRGRPRTSR